MRHNWRAPLKIFCRLKVSLNQFFPVALSVIFLLVYAKCNCASMFKIRLILQTSLSLLEGFFSVNCFFFTSLFEMFKISHVVRCSRIFFLDFCIAKGAKV